MSTYRRTDEYYLKNVETYFIHSRGIPVVKIGISIKVHERLRALQACCPVKLEVVGLMAGDRETELHERFANHRLHGEWFSFVEEIRKFVDEFASLDNLQFAIEPRMSPGRKCDPVAKPKRQKYIKKAQLQSMYCKYGVDASQPDSIASCNFLPLGTRLKLAAIGVRSISDLRNIDECLLLSTHGIGASTLERIKSHFRSAV